eukprot:NODE_7156_length_470_cov_49.871734_g6337_i0.p2 GENE.NODE_7156_length_470_cov_49.871734_g6337_i0~~NODE_7156_length_470_cov_49.871734_g6337_i0.p2  ORF type:complete len:81 (-),score=24.62 NODE_7156_length_470_cov_49.871734_g6337_i0:103-345(-)
MTQENAAEVLRELPRLSRAVQRAMGADGMNVLVNCGEVAGQTVMHTHIHAVPKYKAPPVTTRPLTDNEGASLVAKIQAEL